jgi:hypothetical protein
MSRLTISVFAAAVTLSLLALGSDAVAGQGRPSGSTASLARTPWGDPDLQGTWPGGPVIAVPFERAPELGTKTTLTAAEAAKRNAELNAAFESPQANIFPELGNGPALTSLIVEPENGRLPPMTADGTRRADDWRMRADPQYRAPTAADLRPYDRCITRGVLGSAFPNLYGSGMQIHQAPGVVVIRHEMVHEEQLKPKDPTARPQPRRQPDEHSIAPDRAFSFARSGHPSVRSADRGSTDVGTVMEGRVSAGA